MRKRNDRTVDKKVFEPSIGETCGWQLLTRRMNYCKGDGSVFTKILRLVYLTSQRPQQSPAISCKLMVPVRMTKHLSEATSSTLARANHWLQITGKRVIGAETIKYPLNVYQERPVDTGKPNYTVGVSNFYINVFKLYLDGPYEEPPLEVYQPPPEILPSKAPRSVGCVLL